MVQGQKSAGSSRRQVSAEGLKRDGFSSGEATFVLSKKGGSRPKFNPVADNGLGNGLA